MKLFTRLIATAVLAVAVFSAAAQPAPSPAQAFRPTNGLWLADNKPNHGWTLEITPTNFMFVTVFTYNTDGTPTFLTMQGQYTPTPADPSGNVGRFESPVFRTAGGAPIDSLAPGSATATSIGNAVITFRSGRRATWQMGANTFQLTSIQDYAGIDGGYKLPEYLAGKWMVVRHSRFSNNVEAYETYYLQLTDGGTVDGKRVFNGSCLDRCVVETNAAVFNDTMYMNAVPQFVASLRLTYDPATRQLRSQTTSDSAGYRTWNQELLVVSANEMQGRVYRNPDGSLSNAPDSGVTALGIRFVRLPADFRF